MSTGSAGTLRFFELEEGKKKRKDPIAGERMGPRATYEYTSSGPAHVGGSYVSGVGVYVVVYTHTTLQQSA